MPKALVLRAPGTNCEQEMMRAFALAGAEPCLVHLERAIAEPAMLDGFDLFGFPGGFSYGDDIASGRIFAMKIREKLYPGLKRAIERGCPMIGACNGFQVLVQVGLLPGPEVGAGAGWPESAPAQTVALTDNRDGKFHDRWVPVEYVERSPCVWTKGLGEEFGPTERADAFLLPVAHGEGRFVAASEDVLAGLERGGQVAVKYVDNYNGSQGAIAGVCDATGLILGLMPHPERFLDWNRHPWWTRLDGKLRSRETPGLMMFRNAVGAVSCGGARSAAAGAASAL